jgi:Uma2 family endonuclease
MLEMMTINTEAFRLTDAEFERFCQDNPELRVERNANKEIIIMSPNYTKSGFQHGALLSALFDWNSKEKSGYVFDSSAGFSLRDSSVRMLDVSWVSKEGWKSLDEEDKEKFIHYCPEFVVEIKSKSDRLKDLQLKMKSWIANGCKLAWLIDPEEEKVWIYRADVSIDDIENFEMPLSGETILEGFSFDLKTLRLE